MTDILEFSSEHSQALELARHDNSKSSAQQLFSGLCAAVESSNLIPDAKMVLVELLGRAAEKKVIRERLVSGMPLETKKLDRRNRRIISLVQVAHNNLGCKLNVEGDAYEWAARKHNKDNSSTVIARTVREVWNKRSKTTQRVIDAAWSVVVPYEKVALVAKCLDVDEEFCPVYFGPREIDLEDFSNSPEFQAAAKLALGDLVVETDHRKAFAETWLRACVNHWEIDPNQRGILAD